MTKKLSLIACGLLLSTSTAFAESSLEAAFASGQASGDISIYSNRIDKKGGNADSGYTAGTVGVAYETGSFHDFSAKAGFRAGHKFEEVENDDYKGDFEQNSVMNEAFVKYEVESFALTAGRQEIDLEWIGDFNEAIIEVLDANMVFRHVEYCINF